MGKRVTLTKKKLSHKKLFFNHATVGPVNAMAHKAAVSFLNDYLRIGPPEIQEIYDDYPLKLSEELAKLLHCSSEEVTYIKNTTEGIIIASESLPLKRGDQVLLMSHEYPANLIPWLKKKKDGIDVKFITAEDNHQAFLKLVSSISKKTKAVSISWGQYYDGYLPDMALLSKVCQENGTFLVVDGVHGVAARRLDLQKIHIDILSCGGQKNIGALMGIGFIYVNKKTIPLLLDFKVGIRSVNHSDINGYDIRQTAQRFCDGTQNLIGIVSLHAAVKHINKIGIKNIEKRNIELLDAYKKILSKNNIDFINYENQANILSLRVPDPAGLVGFLRERGIYIKLVQDVARVSFSHTCNVRDFTTMIKYIREWVDG